MSDCSSSACESPTRPIQRTCPINGNKGAAVPRKTVLYHLAEPWQYALNAQNYYFCADPTCPVVYFAEDDTVITKSQLRTEIGIKEPWSEAALICYCFGISRREAQTNPQTKVFVMEQTRESRCACTTFNPSARCCLKDFPR